MTEFEIRHASLFCGLGGGSKGFNQARPDIGTATGRFRCIGGIDSDPAAIRDFSKLAGCRGTVLDLFDRDQYHAFHGAEPPAAWREAGTADIHAAFGQERPHIVFLSAPCKGFSGLMSESKSQTDKYQALNRLTLRGIWLTLEAYQHDPIEMMVFENVPRIASRGRPLLDQIVQLLQHYGYVVNETTHDCGELGGLSQSRKRFLLVARHAEKVPPFLYEPVRRPLGSVGEVLSRMPLPGDVAAAGPKGSSARRNCSASSRRSRSTRPRSTSSSASPKQRRGEGSEQQYHPAGHEWAGAWLRGLWRHAHSPGQQRARRPRAPAMPLLRRLRPGMRGTRRGGQGRAAVGAATAGPARS